MHCRARAFSARGLVCRTHHDSPATVSQSGSPSKLSGNTVGSKASNGMNHSISPDKRGGQANLIGAPGGTEFQNGAAPTHARCPCRGQGTAPKFNLQKVGGTFSSKGQAGLQTHGRHSLPAGRIFFRNLDLLPRFFFEGTSFRILDGRKL